jgi:EAL domain-containing protein (putative c-di-GMP-specific phosphodiesterase class I)
VQNSNLARLSLLEYDEIKIDKSLVDGISEDYKQNIFVIFSDALAKLNKTLVFEGVENEINIALLQQISRCADSGMVFFKSTHPSELAKRLTGVARNPKPVLLVFSTRTFPFFTPKHIVVIFRR